MADYCQVYGVIHFTSPAGWLPVHPGQLRAQRSVTSMGKLYLFSRWVRSVAVWFSIANGPHANHTNTSSHNFTGRMLFLTPNHQCQSTEGKQTTYSGLIFYYQHSRLPCLSPWAFIILGALKNRHFSSVLNWPIVTNHNKIRLITTQNVVIAKITSRVIASQPINTPILPVSSPCSFPSFSCSQFIFLC